jgi:thiol-disulfide isomerase/thioredoxin
MGIPEIYGGKFPTNAPQKIDRSKREGRHPIHGKTALSQKEIALRDLPFVDPTGNQFMLRTWIATHKKPVLLVFWAPWCGPCMDEMPSLVAMSKKLGHILNVLPISLYPITRPEGGLDKALQKFDLPLYHAPDTKKIDSIVTGIPSFFLIGMNGKILMHSSGKRDWESPEEQKSLCAYLVQKPKQAPQSKNSHRSLRSRSSHRNPS